MTNIQTDAQAYVDILYTPANGFGQHCCPRTGVQSHTVLHQGSQKYGQEKFQNAVDAVFERGKS